MQMANIAVHER